MSSCRLLSGSKLLNESISEIYYNETRMQEKGRRKKVLRKKSTHENTLTTTLSIRKRSKKNVIPQEKKTSFKKKGNINAIDQEKKQVLGFFSFMNIEIKNTNYIQTIPADTSG